jgi:hypothetical protein
VNEVHVVVPYWIDDPRRPSGGNVYDRRACRGLAALGWSVHEHTVPGQWPRPDAPARAAVAAALARMSSGSLVLVDGLVASVVPEVLEPEAGRLGLVVLLHVPRDEPREVAALSVASTIVVTSQWTRRWLSDHYALRGNRVYVVPPGVDAAEVADSRQTLSCWPGDPRERQWLRAAARSRRQRLSDWAQTELSAVLSEVAR